MNRKPINLTAKSFEEIALRRDGVPVLVDFWAPWCGPCHMMSPILEELASELDGKAIIAKVNVDEEQYLAQATKISALPTVLLLQNGAVQDVLIGVSNKATLLKKLKPLMAEKAA